ncbi:MAG: hypothetical protein QXS07_01960 [Candidatus Pacearchaeota archaeon]
MKKRRKEKIVKKARTDKKAQFFIFASLIGILIIFSFTPSIIKKTEKPKIYDIGKNFKFESIEVLAKGKLTEFEGKPIDMKEYLDNLTLEFVKYGITQDPRLELIYVWGNQSNVIVYNFADEKAYVYRDGNIVAELEGGRKNISSTLSLGEIKAGIVTKAYEYEKARENFRKSFLLSQPTTNIVVQLGSQNHSFDLSSYESFYLVLRTKRENETFISRQ